MPDPLVLYSAQTLLAYRINQKYYKQKHWVLCSPYRGRGSTATFESVVPPSSSPFEIYKNLHEDVKRGERHSNKIKANREGLLRGANAKLEGHVINLETVGEIAAVLAAAQVSDFSPVLYVIPYKRVSKQIKVVPVERRAHPMSDEYQIDLLFSSALRYDRVPCLGETRCCLQPSLPHPSAQRSKRCTAPFA